MDVTELGDDGLLSMHKQIHEWWKETERPNPKYSKTELIYMHSQVHEELKKRNLRHEFIDSLDDTAIKPGVPREEVHQMSPYATVVPTGKVSGEKVIADDILPRLKPFRVIAPFAFLHGGVVREGTVHDIDVLIRGYEDDTASRRVGFRIRRMFPDLRQRIHVLFDPLGPSVDNIPIYDLVAVPRKPEKVYMASEDFTRTKEENTVVIFRAIWPLKGKSGAQETNLYEIARVPEFFTPDDYPLLIEKKYDGARLQIHCDGKSVKIFSDGGHDVTHRFPETIKETLQWGDAPFILDSETEGWIRGHHIGREEMAGYLSRRSAPDDSAMVFNVFDIMMFRGKDIHGMTLTERKKVLKSLPFKQSTAEVPDPDKSHLNLVPSYIARNPEGVGAAIRLVSQFPGSEGSIIKSAHTIYELDGKTTKWVKYKTLFEVSAIVLGRLPVRNVPNVFKYEVGVLPFRLAKTNPAYIRKYGSGIYMYTGKTFNTNIQANPGEIVSIYVETVFKYINKDTGEERLTLYGPEMIGKRPDLHKPATANEVFIAAREAKRLVLKDESTGETIREMSKARKYIEDLSQVASDFNFELQDLIDIPKGINLESFREMAEDLEEDLKVTGEALTPAHMKVLINTHKLYQGTRFPSTDETKEFVFGSHWRGRSVHIDFRIKWDERTLFGMTLDAQRTEVVKEPVLTVSDARKWQRDPNLFKINNEPGFGAPAQPPKILVQFKQAEPVEWFDYTGAVSPGRVGATKFNWGVFDILDTGPIEILAQKPWYIELYLHGKKYNGYWIIRQMPNIWKLQPSDTERAGPRETQEFVWLIWKAKDQETPYVLSRRAVKQGWIPEKGISALPKNIRERLPPEYKYWEAEDIDHRRSIRDTLVEAMKEGKLLEQPSFALHRRWYKGQTVIRRGPSQVVYDLRIRDRDTVKHFMLDFNPIDSSEVSAYQGQSTDPKWFDVGRGEQTELPFGSELNPSKNTRGWTRMLDEGRVDLSDTRVEFFGQFLKGKWSLEHGSGGIWKMRKEE